MYQRLQAKARWRKVKHVQITEMGSQFLLECRVCKGQGREKTGEGVWRYDHEQP